MVVCSSSSESGNICLSAKLRILLLAVKGRRCLLSAYPALPSLPPLPPHRSWISLWIEMLTHITAFPISPTSLPPHPLPSASLPTV